MGALAPQMAEPVVAEINLQPSAAAPVDKHAVIALRPEHQDKLRAAQAERETALRALGKFVVEEQHITAQKTQLVALLASGSPLALASLGELDMRHLQIVANKQKAMELAIKRSQALDAVGRDIAVAYGVRVDDPDGGVWNLDADQMILHRAS